MTGLYTVKDLAKILAVKPLTIYRMVERGQLPAVKIGKSIRFKPEDINAYLETVRINPESMKGGNQERRKS